MGKIIRRGLQHLFPHLGQQFLFPPGDLYLGHAEEGRRFDLGLFPEIAEDQQLPVGRVQFIQELPQGQPVGEHLLRRLDRQVQLPAVLVVVAHRQREGGEADRQRLAAEAPADAQLFRQLVQPGFPAQLDA